MAAGDMINYEKNANILSKERHDLSYADQPSREYYNPTKIGIYPMCLFFILFVSCAFLFINNFFPYHEFLDNEYHDICMEIMDHVIDLSMRNCVGHFEANPDMSAEEFLTAHDEKLIKKVDDILSK